MPDFWDRWVPFLSDLNANYELTEEGMKHVQDNASASQTSLRTRPRKLERPQVPEVPANVPEYVEW